MTFGEIIYKILIGPLELFFEVVFEIANRQVSNPAYAIIMLSLAMNILVLPLYRRADAVQAEERDRENALAPWIKHIKKTFKGDERFMMLQAYYRENDYKPTDSLKGSISLLLEIPFFIAAYHFLSNLQTLRGVGFGPISDLGAPDALINIGGMSVNVLPILMTLINVISAAIYMKGFPLKSKIQMYDIAAIFLVFLYKSPAGLVFYWTLNNLFSLFKNIFYKIPNPKLILSIGISFLSAALLIVVLFFYPGGSVRIKTICAAALFLIQIPSTYYLINKDKPRSVTLIRRGEELFTPSCIILAVTSGLLIPSAIIGASVEEFIELSSYISPFWYIISALTIAFGVFIVWFRVFFSLASEQGKKVLGLCTCIAAVVSVVDYMFFGKNYGNISSLLVYDSKPSISNSEWLLNLLVITVAALVVFVLSNKKTGFVRLFAIVMCTALLIMGVLNCVNISSTLNKSKDSITAATQEEPELRLSKTGNNVIVIMLDRACGYYLPYLLNENPEIGEILQGFTFYPNTVSYGQVTNVGSPGLYGGYEYTPEKINERDTETLASKQNEALRVMPYIFDDNDYDVTVCDPSYAGYKWIPDLTIYDERPEIHKYITNGKFSAEEYGYYAAGGQKNAIRKRNLFCYSIFRMAPIIFQPTLYSSGSYNGTITDESSGLQIRNGSLTAEGYNNAFMSPYATLCNLSEISTLTDNNNGAFVMMSNDTTHEPQLLQEPDYVPSIVVDNTKFETDGFNRTDADGNEINIGEETSMIHYHADMAALLKLGEWFEWMKKNDIYDNTRIILVSDHARALVGDEIMPVDADGGGVAEDRELDMFSFNALLLVKDFNSNDPLKIDNSFMTNADTPIIATEGLVDDPKNPSTGRSLKDEVSKDGTLDLIYTYDWTVEKEKGCVFQPSYWFSVHDDIFERENWNYLGYY